MAPATLPLLYYYTFGSFLLDAFTQVFDFIELKECAYVVWSVNGFISLPYFVEVALDTEDSSSLKVSSDSFFFAL